GEHGEPASGEHQGVAEVRQGFDEHHEEGAGAEVLAFVYRIRKGRPSVPPGPVNGDPAKKDGRSGVFM
ncbi:MAG: hypothetical protein AB7U27_13005, partial [Aminobacteriaceae bacterium]